MHNKLTVNLCKKSIDFSYKISIIYIDPKGNIHSHLKGSEEMLDYEIQGYLVYFCINGAVCEFNRGFGTEEEAINFIKENRHKWTEYRIEQTRVAIIDF